jgi:hypothetical protein
LQHRMKIHCRLLAWAIGQMVLRHEARLVVWSSSLVSAVSHPKRHAHTHMPTHALHRRSHIVYLYLQADLEHKPQALIPQKHPHLLPISIAGTLFRTLPVVSHNACNKSQPQKLLCAKQKPKRPPQNNNHVDDKPPYGLVLPCLRRGRATRHAAKDPSLLYRPHHRTCTRSQQPATPHCHHGAVCAPLGRDLLPPGYTSSLVHSLKQTAASSSAAGEYAVRDHPAPISSFPSPNPAGKRSRSLRFLVLFFIFCFVLLFISARFQRTGVLCFRDSATHVALLVVPWWATTLPNREKVRCKRKARCTHKGKPGRRG